MKNNWSLDWQNYFHPLLILLAVLCMCFISELLPLITSFSPVVVLSALSHVSLETFPFPHIYFMHHHFLLLKSFLSLHPCVNRDWQQIKGYNVWSNDCVLCLNSWSMIKVLTNGLVLLNSTKIFLYYLVIYICFHPNTFQVSVSYIHNIYITLHLESLSCCISMVQGVHPVAARL